MLGRIEPEQLKSDLTMPWVIVGIMLAMLVAFVIVCIIFGDQIQTAPAGSSASAD